MCVQTTHLEQHVNINKQVYITITFTRPPNTISHNTVSGYGYGKGKNALKLLNSNTHTHLHLINHAKYKKYLKKENFTYHIY
jgi:hypothetical protein